MANLLFVKTWELVVENRKTQTRRIVKPDENTGYSDAEFTVIRNVLTPLKHVRFSVGQQFAVMPARGVRGIRKVADIEITRIRREDVREISEADAVAEGFIDQLDFWHTWVDMHDKSFYETFAYAADMDYLREYGFYDRPDKFYQAWCLDFRVLNVYADAVATARELLAA